jgi:hypothetical protein
MNKRGEVALICIFVILAGILIGGSVANYKEKKRLDRGEDRPK